LRLGTLHGVTGRLRNDLIVNLFAIRALVNREIKVFGGGQYRPLLHVRDLASTIVSQLDIDILGIFNLLERNYRIIDLAHIVQEELPGTKVDIVEAPLQDQRNYRASSSKAVDKLCFSPELCVRDTIRDVARIYKEGRVKDFSNIRYSNMLAISLRHGGEDGCEAD
jgi:nucleoside-diphosphate-sugar epimerase